jgi:hypothetical protein
MMKKMITNNTEKQSDEAYQRLNTWLIAEHGFDFVPKEKPKIPKMKKSNAVKK